MIAQVIAIDYGLKRVGVAVGNTLTKSAEPLETIQNTSDDELLARLSHLIKEWQPKQLVMGMPYNPQAKPAPEQEVEKDVQKKATPSKSSKQHRQLVRKIRSFAIRLGEAVELPVEFIDESFSSAEASQQLKYNRQKGERKHAVKKEDIDKAAACIILERWLNSYTS